MFSFKQTPISILPEGFFLEAKKLPSPEELNKLLAKCKEKTHPSRRLALALKQSYCCLSILNQSNGKLAGFVRATSDHGLNANIWNLVAEPGSNQKILLSVLIKQILGILKRELPGCSISVSSPSIAVKPLLEHGFLKNPNGIRAMAFKLR